MSNIQSLSDKTAIGISALCVVHCLVLPIALTLLPTLASLPVADEAFHKWLLVGIIPASLLAIVIGCRKHRNMSVVVLCFTGILLLILAVVAGHDLFGEAGEKGLTAIGSALLIWGHIKNHNLCKKQACCPQGQSPVQ